MVAVEWLSAFYQLIDFTPIGYSAYVSVVYPDVGFQLPREVVVVVCAVFFGIVLVHGIKLNPSLAAPFHGFVQQFTLAHSPENQFVVVANEQLQGFGGKGALFANLGIAVFHYCAVEVYCYNHCLVFLFLRSYTLLLYIVYSIIVWKNIADVSHGGTSACCLWFIV